MDSDSESEEAPPNTTRFFDRQPTIKQLMSLDSNVNTLIFEGFELTQSEWPMFFKDLAQTHEHLTITDIKFESVNLNDEHLAELCRIFPKIRGLTIMTCEITDDGVKIILQNFHSLQELAIIGNDTTSDTPMIIANNGKYLTKLSVDCVDNYAAEAICENMKGLTVLIIDENTLSLSGLKRISNQFKDLKEIAISLQYGQILYDDVEVARKVCSHLTIWYYNPDY